MKRKPRRKYTRTEIRYIDQEEWAESPEKPESCEERKIILEESQKVIKEYPSEEKALPEVNKISKTNTKAPKENLLFTFLNLQDKI